MKTTLHTPGPWAAAADGMKWKISTLAFVNEQTDGLDNVGTVPIQGTLKNARLIASAPDLLDALDWALRQIEDDLDPDHQAAFNAALSTLRKAKGEA
jgi:hypothetical protein